MLWATQLGVLRTTDIRGRYYTAKLRLIVFRGSLGGKSVS